jgi:hydrogenase nickel incorporation protein HypA/HybF
MHELSICQELMTRVEQVALENRATSVDTIFLSVGPLSGVEAPLLRRAFQIARLGTVAESAELVIQTGSVVIQCNECGASSEVRPNHLLCGSCGNWRVQVTQGEELLILRLELSGIADHPEGVNPHPRNSGSAQPHPESIASQGEPPHV